MELTVNMYVYPENVGQTNHLPARENYGEGTRKQGVKCFEDLAIKLCDFKIH